MEVKVHYITPSNIQHWSCHWLLQSCDRVASTLNFPASDLVIPTASNEEVFVFDRRRTEGHAGNDVIRWGVDFKVLHGVVVSTHRMRDTSCIWAHRETVHHKFNWASHFFSFLLNGKTIFGKIKVLYIKRLEIFYR